MQQLKSGRKLSFFHWFVIMPWTPILGLVLFFFLPWFWALPVYLVVSAVSIAIAWKSWHAIQIPVASGKEAMIGAMAQALSEIGREGQVRFRGEIWSARASDDRKIAVGEWVQIIGLEGLRVIVAKASATGLDSPDKVAKEGADGTT